MSDKETVINVGGNVEKSLKGEYHLDVANILKEAWQKTLQSRVSINVGLFFTLMIGMLISLIVSTYMGGIEQVLADQQASGLLNIVVTLSVSPFLAGVEMMGVFHAVELKTKAKLIFSFLNRGSWVAICALLTSSLITLGFNLYYIPGIYLAVALSLTIPLVVEKRLTPLKAIVLSIKATRFQWFKICALYIALLVLLMLSLVPLMIFAKTSASIIGVIIFLVALTFIAPLFYNVKGILYREIFGMQLETKDVSSMSSNDSFLA